MHLRCHRGLTLVEILLACLMLSALTLLSMPNLAQLADEQKGRLAMQRITRAIEYARSQAVRTGNLVTICKSASASSCKATPQHDAATSMLNSWPQILFLESSIGFPPNTPQIIMAKKLNLGLICP